MYDPRELLRRSPSEIATAVTVLLNVAVLTSILDISKDSVAGINIAVATLLGLFYVKSQTVSTAKLAEVKAATDDAFMFGAQVASPVVGQADSVTVNTSEPITKMESSGAKNIDGGQTTLLIVCIVLAVILGVVGLVTAVKWLLIIALIVFLVGLLTGRSRV